MTFEDQKTKVIRSLAQIMILVWSLIITNCIFVPFFHSEHIYTFTLSQRVML